MADEQTESDLEPRPAYTWPWLLLAAVLLAIALAILWMSWEVARTRMSRELNSPARPTNQLAH
jgi:hypothetical protein